MIPRYTRPEMGRIWSDQNNFSNGLKWSWRLRKRWRNWAWCPAEAARLLRAHAGFDVARILEIESEVKHDVIAFTTAVAETMARAGHARSVALAALRAHFERCGGYGAGAAAATGVRQS